MRVDWMHTYARNDDHYLSCDHSLREQLKHNLMDFEFSSLTSELPNLTSAAVALTLVDTDRGPDVGGLRTTPYPSLTAALVLTRRAAGLSDHAGQWALPGGRVEDGESPEETALRELSEEVGLSCEPEAVLGRMDDYPTRSGFLITPVVVWGGPETSLIPNPSEVHSIYRIPIQEFIREDAPILENIPESDNPILYMPIGNETIAAPTAALIYQFCEVAILGRNTRVAHFEQPYFAWR